MPIWRSSIHVGIKISRLLLAPWKSVLVGNWSVFYSPDCGIRSKRDGSVGSYQSREARDRFVIILPRSFLSSEEGGIFPLGFGLKHHARYGAPDISTHLLSDFSTDSILGTEPREETLRLLTPSAELLGVYSFDQSKYLESISKTARLELDRDAKYSWIFHNLDYKKWVQRHNEARILGLRGLSFGDLKLAASHIVQSLRNPGTAGQEDEVLYFFYSSTRRERGPQNVVNWSDLVCVWNLLLQLIKNRPRAVERLIQTFLRSALNSLGDDELAELQVHGGPTDALRSLLCLSKPRDLWGALGQVLGDLEEPENNLALVIDFGLMASPWEGLVDSIREMTELLPRGTLRVLLSNLPETSTLWKTRPSEILEYDKERKGM